MAGHSKWANIRHRKERADAKKGKIFSKVTKEIISAVKRGGPDPKANPSLRLALDKARKVNMPTDNIERNIKKGSQADQADFIAMTYELYGHGGVGLLVEVMTDNKNRIASDMRIATNKRGGTIATPGAVAFQFDHKGVLTIPTADSARVWDVAMEAGADDIEELPDGGFVVTTEPANLYAMKDALENAQIVVEQAELEYLPKNTMDCSEEDCKANEALIEWLEELDDVDNVYHNMKGE